jgi:FtsP/CotA-like multicopper oxidase with cupredoxin domain
MYLLKHRWSALTRNAWRNRQELITARLTTRRDLLKLGLLTGAGMLIAKHGLSSRVYAADPVSPPTTPFVEPLPIMPIVQPLPGGANDLSPYPSIVPNNAGGEGRTRAHQLYTTYASRFSWPPSKVFEVRQNEALVNVSPDLPQQRMWGFDGQVPGPTYHAYYNEPILVRNRNELPADNGGFGMQQVSTHLHNLHSPSESDGFPGDYFPNPENPAIASANFYDHNYPNVLAGFASTHAPFGDINESLSTLWYHDHRVAFTAQNVYKGLAGFYLLFNELDCGDETRGLVTLPNGSVRAAFKLPGVRDGGPYAPVKYDIPLMLGDRIFDEHGQMFFDLFNTDGILGDKFLVNGKVQPYLEVEPRKYRFRVLNGGPSRFYHLFLTDQGSNTAMPMWQVTNDGNLLPKPISVQSVILSVAERADIVIDFSDKAGQTLYLENRWLQEDGKGPDQNVGVPGALASPGQGNFILQFRVGNTVTSADQSVVNANTTYYTLPSRPLPRVTRTFNFERELQTWMVNGRAFPDAADVVHFRVRKNSNEQWNIQNSSGGWMHPIHVHFEEFRMITRNGVSINSGVEFSRKDVIRLQHNELNTVAFRFRDFEGRYPIHCHNVVHEDHAMMMRWDIDATGDSKTTP